MKTPKKTARYIKIFAFMFITSLLGSCDSGETVNALAPVLPALNWDQGTWDQTNWQ